MLLIQEGYEVAYFTDAHSVVDGDVQDRSDATGHMVYGRIA